MPGDRAINGKALYTPKGAALEYGRIGCNFYTGCPHGCEYCYLKRGAPSKVLGDTKVRLKKCFKDTAHAFTVFYDELCKWKEPCREHGIFLSFSTDPMIKETRYLTFKAIQGAVTQNVPVWVLTKDASFVMEEDILYEDKREYIHFGFTLTGRDDMEPGASPNLVRIMAMRILHNLGYKTFASIEPVVDWPSALQMVKKSVKWCDHYKLGLRSGVRKDYYDLLESGEAITEIVALVCKSGKTIYLKESTRRLLRNFLTESRYKEILSHTVDMDGNPVQADKPERTETDN